MRSTYSAWVSLMACQLDHPRIHDVRVHSVALGVRRRQVHVDVHGEIHKVVQLKSEPQAGLRQMVQGVDNHGKALQKGVLDTEIPKHRRTQKKAQPQAQSRKQALAQI